MGKPWEVYKIHTITNTDVNSELWLGIGPDHSVATLWKVKR